MKNKPWFWAIVFAVAAIAGAGLFLALRSSGGGAAHIYSGGEELYTIDLDAVAYPYDITIEYSGGGYNTVHVEHGSISVSDADCPDLICVRQGAISGGEVPIVCLPHSLVIQMGESE